MPPAPTVHPTSIRDGEVIVVADAETAWHQTWHPPPDPPDGLPHGSAGLCLTSAGEVVPISRSGTRWTLPGGRPEGGETWEDTLRRERREEACATVVRARLLGVSRGHCVRGPWAPEFEIRHRRLVAPADVLASMPSEAPYFPIFQRILDEAGIG